MSLQELLKQYEINNPELIEAVDQWVNEKLSDENGSKIPKSRFDEVIGQRNKLREELEESAATIATQDEKLVQYTEIDVDTLQSENKQLTEDIRAIYATQWQNYANMLDVSENHPQYDKINRIRDDFRYSDSELSLEDLKFNLQAIQPYLKAGLFDTTDFDNTRPQTGDTGKTNLINMFKQFGG
ncbi:MAG: phage scaffolding protein [Candidatus Cloacimonetes bacterium]|nr:phage scaffolding protein [Candidatus Cloacimonadota bacterium]